MAMLAEPRRKQRWTLNPRGKQWSEDSNKFGQKMLEKMGWTSGKGLGANEQGMTEHVHVSYKDDTAGIGFKKDNLDKAWTEHQEGFNDFLQELQKSQSLNVSQTAEVKSELSNKSLELKSKQSRARVHYQKFTRGKDVNKYSSKDIANIFGQKELNGEESSKKNESNDQKSFDPVGTRENTGGVITINGGNMADYFMRKGHGFSSMPKNKRQQESNSESEPEHVGFGFASMAKEKGSHDIEENKETKNTCNYAFENPCLKLNSPENISGSDNRLKSSKKRKSDDSESVLSSDSKKFKEDAVNKSGYKNGFMNAALNLEGRGDEVCNGKEFEVSRAEFGVTNSALDLSDEVVDKKRVTFNDHVEYSTDALKKKKGKATLDKFEVENKKIKKKKKREDSVNNSSSSGFVNEALDVEEVAEEVNDNEINERKSRKSKKRKGSRRSNLETIVEIPEEDKETCENGTGIKKPKLEENVSNDFIPEEQLSSKKSKKKKKKNKEKTEDETITGSKNNVEEIADAVTKIKARSENSECELHKEERRENLSKEKKKKKNKNAERNVEKHEDIISESKTEDNDIDHVEKAAEKIEETTKSKKKKIKQDTHATGPSAEVAHIKDEKEVSDKENANSTDENIPKAKKPKKKKDKKSMDESVTDDNSTHTVSTKEESLKQATNASANTPSKTANHETFNVLSSPWSETAKMSKKLLKSLFHRNAVVYFPGSNIHEIKGYGAEEQ